MKTFVDGLVRRIGLQVDVVEKGLDLVWRNLARVASAQHARTGGVRMSVFSAKYPQRQASLDFRGPYVRFLVAVDVSGRNYRSIVSVSSDGNVSQVCLNGPVEIETKRLKSVILLQYGWS